MSPADVQTVLQEAELTVLVAGTAEDADLPEQWRPIAASTDPAERSRTARALWNDDYLDLVPTFAGLLRTRLLDVRACLLADRPVLAYVLDTDYDGVQLWAGAAPPDAPLDGAGAPPFWSSYPAPLRTFLSTVHAGFREPPHGANVPLPPALMETLADEWASLDMGEHWAEYCREAWEMGSDDVHVPYDRLVLFADNGSGSSGLRMVISPDLLPDRVAVMHGGILTADPFSAQLDRLLVDAEPRHTAAHERAAAEAAAAARSAAGRLVVTRARYVEVTQVPTDG